MKHILSFWIPYLVGLFSTLIIISIAMKEIDWVLVTAVIVGGLVGGGLAFKEKDKVN
jgi:uncharacterized membrane protein YdbT with pleckstrin-like domain